LRGNAFDACVQELATGLADSINRRVEALTTNSTLRITSLLDPRFAYDKAVFSQFCWSTIEDDLKAYARKGLDMETFFIS
jgi:hypothetical protein